MFGENDPRILSTGRHYVYVPAGAMVARVTNGATFTQAVAGNGLIQRYFAFDPTTSQFAQFSLGSPKSWDQRAIAAKFFWCPTASDANNVTWRISATSVGHSDALDPVFSSTSNVTQSGASTSTGKLTSEILILPAGNPQPEDMLVFEVSRDATDSSTITAALFAVHLYFTYSQTSDD
jgi:hypothetical protein